MSHVLKFCVVANDLMKRPVARMGLGLRASKIGGQGWDFDAGHGSKCDLMEFYFGEEVGQEALLGIL